MWRDRKGNPGLLNYDDVLDQLRAVGIRPRDGRLVIDAPGFQRCVVDGEGRETRGWYQLRSMPLRERPGEYAIVGSFGVWRGAENESHQVVVRLDVGMTPEERSLMRQVQVRAQRDAGVEQLRLQQKMADRAAGWWARMDVSGRSAYLERKGLPAGNLYGARVSARGNLVIPAIDSAARIWCLQVIYSDPEIKARKKRDKDYTPKSATYRGRYFVIGPSLYAGGVALVCEGFATGASLHEATGLAVVVAFAAGNLQPAVQEIAKAHRGIRLLICADDDYDWQAIPDKPKLNAGVVAARQAALAVAGAVCLPVFPGDRPTVTHKGPTDFNDLHCHPHGGLHLVAQQVTASLSALDWLPRSAVASARGPAASGGGGSAAAKPELRAFYTLEEAVEKWVLIYGSNGCFFDVDEHTLVPKADVYALTADHVSRDWKRHPNRQVARISEVGFDPTETDASVRCNLWGGWPTVPREGDCSILLDLLYYLCSGEQNGPECAQWVLKWLAYPIQHPGAKMRSTIIFHGDPGAGKNVFFEAIKAIYGDYGRVIDQSAVEDKFNDWASRKLFLVADEVVARNELYYLKNKLKGIITGEWIRINPKQVAAHDERNHVNMVFLSNELQPQVIEAGDRRYFVVWTPPKLSKPFYRDVGQALKNGAIPALHHYLLHLPLGDFNEHTEPPMTAAKRSVQELSASSTDRFVSEWSAGDTPWPFGMCSSGQLYTAYSRWCSTRGEKARAQLHLSAYVGKLNGWAIQHKDVFGNCMYSGSPRRMRMIVPDSGLIEDHIKRGVPEADLRKPADKSEAQWATDCFFRMSSALGEAS